MTTHERKIDDLIAPVHEAFFGEHFTGQQHLYKVLRNAIEEAYVLGQRDAVTTWQGIANTHARDLKHALERIDELKQHVLDFARDHAKSVLTAEHKNPVMTKILVTDQFCGLSPYELQQRPVNFEHLCTEMLAQVRPQHDFRPTHVAVVDLKTYRAQHCTTVWTADENGMAKAIIMNWDSSD